jgi:hypothetical protein
MANESPRGGDLGEGRPAPELIESVRADLSAIDAVVFHEASVSLNKHLMDITAAIRRIFRSPRG